jgi:aspartate dehydrogenase
VKSIALIGCGSIGSRLAAAMDKDIIEGKLTALYDIVRDRCKNIIRDLSSQKPIAASSFEELLTTQPDVVVEAASQDAVRSYALSVLRAGADLVIMSVGALLDRKLLAELLAEASRSGRRIYVPTGAIAGLDAIR